MTAKKKGAAKISTAELRRALKAVGAKDLKNPTLILVAKELKYGLGNKKAMKSFRGRMLHIDLSALHEEWFTRYVILSIHFLFVLKFDSKNMRNKFSFSIGIESMNFDKWIFFRVSLPFFLCKNNFWVKKIVICKKKSIEITWFLLFFFCCYVTNVCSLFHFLTVSFAVQHQQPTHLRWLLHSPTYEQTKNKKKSSKKNITITIETRMNKSQ